MGLAKRGGPLIFRGTLVHIYPDLPEGDKQGPGYFKCCQGKAPGGEGWLYPAVLAINLNGVWHTFDKQRRTSTSLRFLYNMDNF